MFTAIGDLSGYNSYIWNTGDVTQSIDVTQSGFYFVNVDEERLPFKEKSFYLVYSNLYLHWTNDVLLSFSEIYKVLKPISDFFNYVASLIRYKKYSLKNK